MFRTASITLLVFCASSFGQESVFHTLRVDKKNGAQTGIALITVKDKPKRISTGLPTLANYAGTECAADRA
jgi:hypothetical protein